MKKWAMIIDIAKCHDCNNCFLACKDEFYENDFPPYSAPQPRHGHRWIDILRQERGEFPRVDVAYLPLPCMHCDDAACIKGAKNDAVYKREDGLVIIDPVKAKGQKGLVDSCPYGVIWWNAELDIPQKCTMCAHLLDDGWNQPRCSQACPTGAMQFLSVTDSELDTLIQSEDLKVYHPEFGLKPRVYYKNLHRFTHSFIAGNIVVKETDECAEGVTITLRNSSGDTLGSTITNNYGDFKVDMIEKRKAPLRLEITCSGFEKMELKIDQEDSKDIGTIFIK